MPFRRRRQRRHNIKAKTGACVYLVEAGEAVIKIGYSTNVAKRVEALQVGCAERIRLVKTWFDDRAHTIEKLAHHFLKPYRSSGQGEWFYIHAGIGVIVIDELFRQFPRNRANNPTPSILLVCKNCGHSGIADYTRAGTFRCSHCNESRQISFHPFPCQVEANTESVAST